MTAVALRVEDSGGSGDPVLLYHAIGCDHRMWDAVVPLLAPHFRLIRIDARGHGRSPLTPRPYSLEQLADDALVVLDRLRIEKAHCVGLSMGGMAGQAFALAHPDRLGRLVIANSTSSYGPDGRSMWRSRIQLVEQGGLAAIQEMVMGRYFSEPFRANHPDIVTAVAERFLGTPAEGYLGCCDAISGLDFTARLPSIEAATLVIAGELDAGTPISMSKAIAASIPDARLAVIEGAAHLSAVEKPAEFACLIHDFLD